MSSEILSRPKVITVIKCLTCDYSEERQFQVGDYVMKVIEDKKCPKDGGELRIIGIYALPEQRK
ncbi:MAG: hypothetical protein QXV69_01960 [Sulfolobaceae archaeon]